MVPARSRDGVPWWWWREASGPAQNQHRQERSVVLGANVLVFSTVRGPSRLAGVQVSRVCLRALMRTPTHVGE